MKRFWVRFLPDYLLLVVDWYCSTEKQMESWTLAVYSHYKLPPTIIEVNSEVKYQFICHTYVSIMVTVQSSLTDWTIS